VPYNTDEKLKSYLDTNTLKQEQMCAAVLANNKNFTNRQPQQPRGGMDGSRDMIVTYKDNYLAYVAVGFVNTANDSSKQRSSIKEKFKKDLEKAINHEMKPDVFVFFTNITTTSPMKDDFNKQANSKGLLHCEQYDRERIRHELDNVNGFAIRFQYLDIPLSEAEQFSFFSCWGDDIQSVISTGFHKVENTLNRLLFLNEANAPIFNFEVVLELDRSYALDDIGNYRVYCCAEPTDVTIEIEAIFFGCFSRANNRIDQHDIIATQAETIYGIYGSQWAGYRNSNKEGYTQISSSGSSQVGTDEIQRISIHYGDYIWRSIPPHLLLKDIDSTMYAVYINESLAHKIERIKVYSNGYKLSEYQSSNFHIEKIETEFNVPVKFTDDELSSSWAIVRPNKSSTFIFNFLDSTPVRRFTAKQIRECHNSVFCGIIAL
jgi:RNase H-fold protein (predicted Holliday junction resolvase)